jgi:hypothetical protein
MTKFQFRQIRQSSSAAEGVGCLSNLRRITGPCPIKLDVAEVGTSYGQHVC